MNDWINESALIINILRYSIYLELGRYDLSPEPPPLEGEGEWGWGHFKVWGYHNVRVLVLALVWCLIICVKHINLIITAKNNQKSRLLNYSLHLSKVLYDDTYFRRYHLCACHATGVLCDRCYQGERQSDVSHLCKDLFSQESRVWYSDR